MTTPLAWIPQLDGIKLPACELFDEVVQQWLIPKVDLDPSWAKKNLFPVFATVTDAEAIWETVLAMWRLKQREEDGGEEKVWQDHVVAWMVSGEIVCLDVC